MTGVAARDGDARPVRRVGEAGTLGGSRIVPGITGVSETGVQSNYRRLADAPTLPVALAEAGFGVSALDDIVLADEVRPGMPDEIALADADGSGVPDEVALADVDGSGMLPAAPVPPAAAACASLSFG